MNFAKIGKYLFYLRFQLQPKNDQKTVEPV